MNVNERESRAEGPVRAEQRPGTNRSSTTAAVPQAALRIGVLQSGRIVEERLVTGAEVSVGPTGRDTFVLPPPESGEAPRSHLLFTRGPDGYTLHVAPGMEGRFTADRQGAIQSVSSLAPTARGDSTRVPLGMGSRGKILVGDSTILFQVVERPSLQRPQLPPSLRASIRANLDWAMLAVAAVSVMGHAGFVAYLRQIDLPRVDIEQVSPRVAQFRETWKLPEPKPIEPKTDPNHGVAKPTPSPRPHPSPTVAHEPGHAPPKPGISSRDKEAVTKLVHSMIGAQGEGGAMEDLLKHGNVSTDFDTIAKNGAEIASSSNGPLTPRTGGGPRGPATIDGIRGVHGNDVDTGDRRNDRGPVCPGGSCLPPPTTEDPPADCNMSPIVGELKRRRGALVACYQRVIKREGGLAGKIMLHLSISAAGRVTRATIDQDTLGEAQLDQCILDSASRWIFPDAACGAFDFTYPIIFQSSPQ